MAGEIFKVIGVIISVILADALVCLVFNEILGAGEDDDAWILPLGINAVGFIVVTAVLICKMI